MSSPLLSSPPGVVATIAAYEFDLMEFRLKQITSKKNVLLEPSQLLIWRGCDLIGLGKPMFTFRAAIFTLELTKTTCCIIMPHHERVFPSVSSMLIITLPPKGERSIAISVSVCVYLSFSVRNHIFGTTSPIVTKFLCMLPMAVARSSSGGVVIRYVLPVYG